MWERQRTWAPRWVDYELTATHEQRNKRHQDATVWSARADAPGTTPEYAARLVADAAAARAEVEQLDAQLAELEEDSRIYGEWVVHTAVARDKGERGAFELRARGWTRSPARTG